MHIRLGALVMTILFLGSSLGVSAQSVSDLQAQLALLMQQLQALQNIPTSPVTQITTPGSPGCAQVFFRDLKPGDTDATTGGDVSRIQRYLSNNPSWYPEGLVSGFYGTLTTRAVQRFQAAKGIIDYGTPETTGYGRIGPKTRQAMTSCSNYDPNPTPTPPPYPYPLPSPTPTPTPPLSGPVTVEFSTGQYYEARGNGFYVKVVSMGSSSAFVEVGVPRCGQPRWPSEGGNSSTPTCQPVGEVRQTSISIGTATTIPTLVGSISLQVLSSTGNRVRIIITPGNLTNPTPTPVPNTITCSLNANKSYVTLNESVTLTWSSANAVSARWIQGPFVGTSAGTQGTASISTMTESRPFTLEFTGQGGATKTCSVTVNVRGEPAVSVLLPESGMTVQRGQPLWISWSSTDVPLNSRVRIEIYPASTSVVTGNNDYGILSAGAVTGTYNWTIPSSTAQVVADTGFITGLANGFHRIVAKLYTGDTCWGYCVAAPRTIYSTGSSGPFLIGTTTPAYSEASYYSQGTYYSQNSYYYQGYYGGK